MIMDDLLVAGTDDEEHLRNLEGGLQAVPEVRTKYVFMAPSVIYFVFF